MKNIFSGNREKLFLVKNGFSMTELIFAIAIIAIMTGVLFVNYNRRSKLEKEVEMATRQVAAQIRALQSDALNGKNVNSAVICSSEFSVANDYEYKIIYRNCSNGVESEQNIKVNQGKNNVKISGNDINFEVPHGTTVNGKIVLTSANNSSIKGSVCVCSSGNIVEEKNPSCGC